MMQFINKLRRTVAGILCLCMIAGMLPSYMQKAEAAQVGAATELEADLIQISTDGGYTFSNDSFGKPGIKAGVFAQFGCPALGDWVAFDLGDTVLSPGDYDVSMNYYAAASGCIVDLFLVPASTADIGAYIAGKEASGSVDMQAGSNVKFTANAPVEDKYLLVIQAAEKGATTDSTWKGVCYFCVQNISMQKIFPVTETFKFLFDDRKWHTLYSTFTDYNANLNSNWKYYAHAASAWMGTDGEPLELTEMIGKPTYPNTDMGTYHRDYGIYFYSETSNRWMAMALDVKTPGVYLLEMKGYCYNLGAKVDFYLFPEEDVDAAANATALEKQAAVEKNLISANYAGQMNQKVAAANAGDYTQTLPNSIVIPKAGEYVLVMKCAEQYWCHLASMTTRRVGDVPPTQLVMTAGSEKLKPGEKTKLDIEFYVEGKEVALDKSQVTVDISPAGIASYDAATGELSALEEGTATVTASVNHEGEELTASFDLLVEFPYFTYNLPLKNWNEITTYNSYSVAGNWMYWGYSESTWPNACFTMDNYGTIRLTSQGTNFLVDSPDKWVALKVKVDEPGTYSVNGTYYGGPSGGINELYMIPAEGIETEADVTAALTMDKLLGTVDYYAAAWTEDMPMTLRTMTLDKGEYLLVTKGTGTKRSASSNYWAFTKMLKFKTSKYILDFALNESELEYNTSTESNFALELFDGTEIPKEDVKVNYASSNEKIAVVSQSGRVTAVGEGTAYITVNVFRGDEKIYEIAKVTVKDSSDPESAKLDAPEALYVRGTDELEFTVKMKSGNEIRTLGESDSIEYQVTDPEGAIEFSNGKMTGVKPGTVTVKAKLNFRGFTLETEPVTVEVKNSEKGKSTIWTDEKREALLYNAANYPDVKSKANSYRSTADKYLENLESLYGMIVAEGLPRYYHISKATDDDKTTCRYCKVDITSEYGSYGWITDPINAPWKIQCPNCRKRFPSNDFASYYELGLDEHGVFNKELAEARHIAKFGGLHGTGYLKNTMYPEMEERFDAEKGETVNAGIHNWGVDDGFGDYQIITSTDKDGNPVKTEQRSYYVAYYIHEGLWRGIINSSLNAFKNAYLYTGEAKYGRAGAILLDRIADVYPDLWYYQWTDMRADGGYKGKESDPVWSCGPAANYAEMYDVYYPMYEDAQLIDYLSKKSVLYNQENPKNSAAALRKNAEDGILRAVFDAAVEGSLGGNFGTTQSAVIAAAVALNTMPETGEWLDWVMAPGAQIVGGAESANRTGGNVLPQLIEVVDRDGMGNEAAPGYNAMWISYLQKGADMLSHYELYPEANLYENPKFMKMFSAQLPIVMGGYYTAQIGDMGSFAGKEFGVTTAPLVAAYQATGDILYAQALYQFNGRSAKGLKYDDTVKNPSSLEDEVQKIIDTYGEMDMGSTAQTGYGLYALRDGKIYPNSNTKRDFWMYTGTTAGHGHWDALNLGMSAYGINMAPEIGYPKYTGTDANRIQWVSSTIAHNTVVVDEKNCEPLDDRGTPLHFDDAGKVKVMDASDSKVYPQTDEYRRTVVMVEVDDQVSYGVDFFRIAGGRDHLYSFHSQSNTVETDGLNLEPQSGITYAGKIAGEDVPYGADPHPDSGKTWYSNDLTYPAGYTWLDNVESDHAPEKQFSVDFKISDLRNILKDSSDIHLRMTMVNDFALDEVSIVDGYPVDSASNPKTNIKYVLARRKGEEKLDTLFTTVLEPYKGDRYLSGMEAANVTHADGSELSQGEMVKAVKVTHKDGRVDYIVYAQDNTVEYTVDGLFNFKGFVGVATYESAGEDEELTAENLAYTYLNDGEIIADTVDAQPAYTGMVTSFTDELSMQNYINVIFDQQLTDEQIAALAGRLIYVENDGVENGVYQIKGAKALSGSAVELDIGDVTPVRAYKDSSDISKGFVYNISGGQLFSIPLSYVSDTAPTLAKDGGSYNAAAGSKISFSVSAKSDYGRALTYEAVTLPRGASFDAETHTFSWTPDSTQIGEHSTSIKVSDGVLSTTYNAIITVYRATGSATNTPTVDIGSGTDSGSGGGASGGAGGGGSSSSGGETSGDTGNIGDDTTGDDNTDVGDDVLDVPSERFIDIGNHTWAKDAIYGLVDAGVVNGTSPNTYSPAKNIKRADFAIMLVRAFGITQGEGENFADVDESKYYAEELRLAKANGIVNGVGNNNFNPEGEITRQDMMLMLTRALDAQGKELSDVDLSALTQFTDAAEISDYARDAVSRVVRDGIIAGAAGRINPLGKATRAEVAVMLGRIFL